MQLVIQKPNPPTPPPTLPLTALAAVPDAAAHAAAHHMPLMYAITIVAAVPNTADTHQKH